MQAFALSKELCFCVLSGLSGPEALTRYTVFSSSEGFTSGLLELDTDLRTPKCRRERRPLQPSIKPLGVPLTASMLPRDEDP